MREPAGGSEGRLEIRAVVSDRRKVAPAPTSGSARDAEDELRAGIYRVRAAGSGETERQKESAFERLGAGVAAPATPITYWHISACGSRHVTASSRTGALILPCCM